MKMKPFFLTFALTAAILLMGGSAYANTITFSTNDPATGFNGSGNLTLNSNLGAAATLTFIPEANSVTGVPSNVNYGIFALLCPSCGTQASTLGSSFPSFTFDLVLTDATNNASGVFVGTSTGGLVWSDVSQITVNWAPLELGPGMNNALSGDFGTTQFSTTVFTGIVAPNSGLVPGQTTVQGFVDDTAIPEPATLSMVGGLLLVFGLLRRKMVARS